MKNWFAIIALIVTGCTDPGLWVGIPNGEPCARNGECASQACYQDVCVPPEEVPDLGDMATDADMPTDADADLDATDASMDADDGADG